MVSTYFINLDHREDRKHHMEEELMRMDIVAKRFPGVLTQPGGVGCARSHVAVLELGAIQSEPVLVLEDDVKFLVTPEEFKNLLAHLPADYDVVMFGYGGLEGEPVDATWGRVRAAHNACAYLVAPHYVSVLQHNILEAAAMFERAPMYHWLYSHDQYWKSLQKTGHWYYPLLCVARQIMSYSDIALCVTTRD